MLTTKSPKIAIVHDDFIQMGGAEKLVLAMLEIWPNADLHAVRSNKIWKNKLADLFSKSVKATWLQSLVLPESYSKYSYLFYPLAVESIKLDDYDLVISSSARYAHGVITKPETLHVAYVNSPARFIWQEELQPDQPWFRPIIHWHKVWDRVASRRPDFLITNSRTPARRIEKFWGRSADAVVYPFADLGVCQLGQRIGQSTVENYFLLISRLNRWKKIEIAIEAFNHLHRKLLIVGDGPDRKRLESLASDSVRFLGSISDEEKVKYLVSCQALIVTQEEDFGIVMVEANACGVPIIAYEAGGAEEIVKDGVNGTFFSQQSSDSLSGVVERFDRTLFSKENCLSAARRFDKEGFKAGLESFIMSKLILKKD